MSVSWHDLLGGIGVLFILIAYLLLQLERLSPTRPPYLLANGLGSFLILVSLVNEFNLSLVARDLVRDQGSEAATLVLVDEIVNRAFPLKQRNEHRTPPGNPLARREQQVPCRNFDSVRENDRLSRGGPDGPIPVGGRGEKARLTYLYRVNRDSGGSCSRAALTSSEVAGVQKWHSRAVAAPRPGIRGGSRLESGFPAFASPSPRLERRDPS